MTRSAGFLHRVPGIVLSLVLVGCGGGSMQESARQLQSVMVAPAAADAMSFPGGRVQFTATGNFTMAPMTVTPLTVKWTVGSATMMPPMQSMSAGESMPAGPSIDANGIAQCNGSVGVVAIQASAPANPSMPISQMGTMTMNVMGQAQLTCP